MRTRKLATSVAAGLGAVVVGTVSAAAATVTVQPNETLFKLAKVHGVSLSSLEQANPSVKNPNMIYPGQSVNLPSSTTPAATTTSSSYDTQVFSLVNQQREHYGLKPLTWDAKLAKMASDKATDMDVHHYFDHTSPTYGSPFDMMTTYGISYSYAGENIAEGQTSPSEVMTDWMNSPGHRANILDSHYTEIGVGYKDGYWVQEFIGS